MDETPSTTPSGSIPRTANHWPPAWLAASMIATTAMSLAAAHAPPRIRLIGLFSIAFGLLIGWLVVQLAEMLEVRPSRGMIGIVAAAFTFCGLIGSTWETWRLDESRHGPSEKDRIAARLIEQMKSSTNDSETIPFDSSASSSFRWYLSHRIRQLGFWASPWPELFWGIELLAASVASAWISTRIRSSGSTGMA